MFSVIGYNGRRADATGSHEYTNLSELIVSRKMGSVSSMKIKFSFQNDSIHCRASLVIVLNFALLYSCDKSKGLLDDL